MKPALALMATALGSAALSWIEIKKFWPDARCLLEEE